MADMSTMGAQIGNKLPRRVNADGPNPVEVSHELRAEGKGLVASFGEVEVARTPEQIALKRKEILSRPDHPTEVEQLESLIANEVAQEMTAEAQD